MKYNLTEKLLLFITDLIDYGKRWNWKDIGAMLLEDPRLHHHEKWLVYYLGDVHKRKKLYSTFQNLKRRGFVKKIEAKNATGLILSRKGEEKILALKFKNIDKVKIKDGSWIMVLFDVPEKMRKSRDVFRQNLHELGFEQMQKSVWITPYDVIKELKELIDGTRLKNFVRFLLVKEIQK